MLPTMSLPLFMLPTMSLLLLLLPTMLLLLFMLPTTLLALPKFLPLPPSTLPAWPLLLSLLLEDSMLLLVAMWLTTPVLSMLPEQTKLSIFSMETLSNKLPP